MNVWHSPGLQASCRWLATNHPVELSTYFPPRSVHCCHLSGNLRIAATYHSSEILRIESRTTPRHQWFGFFSRWVVLSFRWTERSPMVPVCVLLVYCCTVLHCLGATNPGVPVVLGAVSTLLTGCRPCPMYLVMCFSEVIWWLKIWMLLRTLATVTHLAVGLNSARCGTTLINLLLI